MSNLLPPVPRNVFYVQAWRYFLKALSKTDYARFQGRAGRFEYWSVTIIGTLVSLLPLIFCFIPHWYSITCAFLAAFFLFAYLALPLLAVYVRRLHDVGWSGKWIALHYGIICLPFSVSVFHVTQMYLMGYDYLSLSESLESWALYTMPISHILGLLLFILTVLPGNPTKNKYGDKV